MTGSGRATVRARVAAFPGSSVLGGARLQELSGQLHARLQNLDPDQPTLGIEVEMDLAVHRERIARLVLATPPAFLRPCRSVPGTAAAGPRAGRQHGHRSPRQHPQRGYGPHWVQPGGQLGQRMILASGASTELAVEQAVAPPVCRKRGISAAAAGGTGGFSGSTWAGALAAAGAAWARAGIAKPRRISPDFSPKARRLILSRR
jgi:hypothetical protein